MKWLSKVAARAGIDGLLHVIVSVLIVLIVQIFGPWWVAVLAALLAGLAKEYIWDKWLKRGTFEVKDLKCDLTGIVLGCLAFF
jgi:hypothetical protein